MFRKIIRNLNFMKTISNLIFIATLVVAFSGCQSPKENLPCLDVSADYPTKEINLADIAKVRYLHLNSDDQAYLYSGSIQVMSTSKVMVADARSGNILFFSQDGMPVSHFNHRGNGPGEYGYAHRVFYDEEADNVFVVEPTPVNIIHVYSSTGEHKRDITLPEGTMVMNDIVSFDHQSFFFYDISLDHKMVRVNEAGADMPVRDYVASFYRISKTNGAVLDSVVLPVTPLFLGIKYNGNRIPGFKNRLIKRQEGVFICNPENDTVFIYNNKKDLTPVISKKPLAPSMDPIAYLNNCVDVGNYQFMQVYTARPGDKFPGILPARYYMRNKETGEIVRQKLVSPDYKGKEFFIGPIESRASGLGNSVLFELKLIELKEANAQNKLSGKLKELVDTLTDDDNNVFMIVSFE